MSEEMTRAEVEQYLALAREDLVAARDNLQCRGLWRSKHQGLIAAFGEHFVKPGLIEPHYGRILHNAFEARLDSDYGPHPDLNESSAEQLISNAESFVTRLARILESG
jgi:uncharacterized protein (UPF0332 family)